MSTFSFPHQARLIRMNLICFVWQSAAIAIEPATCYPILSSDLNSDVAPMFEDYPIEVVDINEPAPLNLHSHPVARRFQTVLQEGLLTGPDFAGHYTLVGWGCGAGCLDFAIVDALTGDLIYREGIPEIYTGRLMSNDFMNETLHLHSGLRYQISSNLLIILGTLGDHREGAFYYLFNGTDFKLIHSTLVNKKMCE